MFYFKELNQHKELPTSENLEEHRKKYNLYFKISQNNQLQFYTAFARFLNLKNLTEFKTNSSLSVLKKDLINYLK
jgi:hypothetical protein